MNAATPQPAVVITGGAAGIGYAIAEAFAQAAYPVAIVDVSKDGAVAAATQLANAIGAKVYGIAADVTDRAACKAAHAEIIAALGPIGVLVNNAGIMPQQKGRIEELPPDFFDQMMSIHVGGAVNWCRLVMPGMREAGFGRIINLSSINAFQAPPHRFGYVTAKKALRGLTEALALESARAGITVNAIAPGYVLTDTLKERASQGLLNHDSIAERTPVGRWAYPEEVAHLALFLADRASAYITGTTILIDGGLSIRGDAGEDISNSPYVPHSQN